MKGNMEALVEQLIAWAKQQPEILALYLYGSVAEEHANDLSDLDVGLLLRSELSKHEMWRLEDNWAALWPEVIDFRILNTAPLPFQFDVIHHGERLWSANANLVAAQESLISRNYHEEEPRLQQEWDAHIKQVMEARSATEQEEYQSTLDKVRTVHRRVTGAEKYSVAQITGNSK